jgi:hypothetical protein
MNRIGEAARLPDDPSFFDDTHRALWLLTHVAINPIAAWRRAILGALDTALRETDQSADAVRVATIARRCLVAPTKKNIDEADKELDRIGDSQTAPMISPAALALQATQFATKAAANFAAHQSVYTLDKCADPLAVAGRAAVAEEQRQREFLALQLALGKELYTTKAVIGLWKTDDDDDENYWLDRSRFEEGHVPLFNCREFFEDERVVKCGYRDNDRVPVAQILELAGYIPAIEVLGHACSERLTGRRIIAAAALDAARRVLPVWQLRYPEEFKAESDDVSKLSTRAANDAISAAERYLQNPGEGEWDKAKDGFWRLFATNTAAQFAGSDASAALHASEFAAREAYAEYDKDPKAYGNAVEKKLAAERPVWGADAVHCAGSAVINAVDTAFATFAVGPLFACRLAGILRSVKMVASAGTALAAGKHKDWIVARFANRIFDELNYPTLLPIDKIADERQHQMSFLLQRRFSLWRKAL